MIRYGTQYGGWLIPKDASLNSDSIIYSGGVGEDMSFDIKLQSIYDSNIYLIDPTQKAKNHYYDCIEYYKDKNFKFSSNIQHDYYNQIQNEVPNFDKIKYIEKGLWDKDDKLKFYKQDNKNCVSQSLINGMFGCDFDIVDVTTIKKIMETHNHDKIDLLKLDIEGAENKVLQKMLDDKIYPKYLCIEFDLLLKNKDPGNETKEIINRLESEGYKILVNDRLNITFERTM